jgi:nucleoside-diphosphate-sugar epimerase
VTGCAGFIGSSLSRRLLNEGFFVIGIDDFIDNYDMKIKEKNLNSLLGQNRFSFLRNNILKVDWQPLLADVDYVFHQAALPGVRTSWGSSFNQYLKNNAMATQILLEGAKNSGIKKFVYASSSSIYGITSGSTDETFPQRPHSPYGVTKLAGEQLCHLYADNYGVPTISLRYFTVYGPGQRPDMAFHKFVRAMIHNEPFIVFGDGSQTRDFTYIDDAVEANLLALKSEMDGVAFNIGGRSRVVLNDVIQTLGGMIGVTPKIQYIQKQAGDPPHTWANIEKAELELGYCPKVALEDGLNQQIKYIRDLYP